MNFMFAQLNDIQIFRVLRDFKAKNSKVSASHKWRSGLLALCLLGSAAVQAQVVALLVTSATDLGRDEVVNVTVNWSRTIDGSGDTITVPIPPELTVNPPNPPAGCVYSAPNDKATSFL